MHDAEGLEDDALEEWSDGYGELRRFFGRMQHAQAHTCAIPSNHTNVYKCLFIIQSSSPHLAAGAAPFGAGREVGDPLAEFGEQWWWPEPMGFIYHHLPDFA